MKKSEDYLKSIEELMGSNNELLENNLKTLSACKTITYRIFLLLTV